MAQSLLTPVEWLSCLAPASLDHLMGTHPWMLPVQVWQCPHESVDHVQLAMLHAAWSPAGTGGYPLQQSLRVGFVRSIHP